MSAVVEDCIKIVENQVYNCLQVCFKIEDRSNQADQLQGVDMTDWLVLGCGSDTSLSSWTAEQLSDLPAGTATVLTANFPFISLYWGASE